MVKIKFCPICGAKVDDENEVIFQQTYGYVVLGKGTSTDNASFEDCTEDFPEPIGEPKPIGCEKCGGSKE